MRECELREPKTRNYKRQPLLSFVPQKFLNKIQFVLSFIFIHFSLPCHISHTLTHTRFRNIQQFAICIAFKCFMPRVIPHSGAMCRTVIVPLTSLANDIINIFHDIHKAKCWQHDPCELCTPVGS